MPSRLLMSRPKSIPATASWKTQGSGFCTSSLAGDEDGTSSPLFTPALKINKLHSQWKKTPFQTSKALVLSGGRKNLGRKPWTSFPEGKGEALSLVGSVNPNPSGTLTLYKVRSLTFAAGFWQGPRAWQTLLHWRHIRLQEHPCLNHNLPEWVWAWCSKILGQKTEKRYQERTTQSTQPSVRVGSTSEDATNHNGQSPQKVCICEERADIFSWH